ncbi:MAG: pilus assembly protein PilM [Ignavibacteriales bacterium]|nr:pilus assembly protein PilM [Ignavibacteriales bacterium]
MRSSYYVGVSLYKGQIQLAELDHGKNKTVTALSERSTAIDFSQDNNFSADHPQVNTFVYELEELLKENKIHSKTISFALPTEPILLTVIPVDAALQGNELNAHVQWEFEQYYPNVAVKDYMVSAYPIPGPKDSAKEVFLVGVRRGLIAFLKRAASELRMQVHVIDIDHFSAEKTLRFCHPEVLKENVLLFGLRGSSADASMVAQGQYTDYRGFTVDGLDDLKKCVLTYKQHLEQKGGVASPTKIILYGFDVTSQIINQIQKETGIATLALDCVRNLVPSKKLYEAYVKDSSRFAAAIGLALRTQ